MPLFQVTGTTDTGSLFNCAFAVVSSERRESYDFLIRSFNAVRQEVGAQAPSVAITDFEDALRSALLEVLSTVQLQLCIFHINANVDLNVKRKWLGDGAVEVQDEFDVNKDKESVEASALARKEQKAAAAALLHNPQTAALNEISPRGHRVRALPTGFCQLWAYVLYADSEVDFDAAWRKLQADVADQTLALSYLANTYIRLRHQWAQCFISEYENFGSYVITGHADLYTVFRAIDEMLANKEREYVEATAIMESRTRREYLRQPWLGDVTKQILEILKTTGGQLTKYDIHPRWWLEQPLDLNDALMRIKDPRVVTSLRGRPRNQKIPNPTSTPASSILPSSSLPSSSLPSSSRQPRPPRKATNPAPRPVRARIRRNRSAFEYDAEDELAAEPPQETVQDCITVGGDVSTSTRRSRRRTGQPPASTAPGISDPVT
ncbi:hypothetical protein CLIM01_15037 [Colletotrichum limetticola]|uniref:MULE transposase domain-containing protein n=1 Tax=Colletotrichum limetticola TaxID=1209924 RepID=A0ABQ9PB36_9PEZI|nr:hypothetical protein CLIM01_15037 [Colletotrichum limetticola]